MQRLLADFVQLSCQILFPNLYFSSGDWSRRYACAKF